MTHLFTKFSRECKEIDHLIGLECNSQYLSIDDVKLDTTDGDHTCKFLHLNVRSIMKNLSDVKDMLHKLSEQNIRLSILLLCETFLNNNSKSLVHIPHYQMYSIERQNKLGGGIAIFVHETIKVRKVLLREITDSVEILILEADIGNKKYALGEFYRIPNTNPIDLLSYLNDTVLPIVRKYDEVILGCDQNIDFLSCKKYKGADDLFSIMLQNDLIPTIKIPTRVTHDQATLIDNVYCKTKSQKVKSCVIMENISDHYPCLLFLDHEWNYYKSDSFTYRKYNKDSFDKINHDLLHTSWDEIIKTDDVNIAYECLLRSIQNALDEHMPLKTDSSDNRIESFKEPWMCVRLDKYNRKCKKLYVKQKRTPTEENIKRYNLTLKKLKRFEKNKYYRDKFEKVKDNSRSIWNILNSLCNKRCNKLDIPFLLYNSARISSHTEISNALNDHFKTAGEIVQRGIKNVSTTPNNFVTKCNVKLSHIRTSETEVERVIKGLKDKKSFGLDGISNLILKNIAVSIRVPLSCICNLSFQTGVFPDSMKIAKIIPLHKGGDATKCENYRPISLLPVISKVLEKIAFKRLVVHLEENNILYAKQFGFRAKHSTNDAINVLCSEILKTNDTGLDALVVFIDLKKAFDTCSHETILSKLNLIGVDGHLLEWFTNYFRGRKQFVSYGDADSAMSNISI